MAKSFAEFRKGWPVVASSSLGVGLGLSPLPFYTIGVFAPELVKAFGWGFGDILFGLTVMTIAVVVISPIVGMIADRIGVRKVALSALCLFALSFAMFALSNGSLFLFYSTWALIAITGAGTLPMTWTRAVNNWFYERKGLALGLTLLGTGLFGPLAKVIANFMINEYSWRVAYLTLAAMPFLIAFPVAWLWFRDTDDPKANTQDIAPQTLQGQTLKQTLLDWRVYILTICFIPVSFAIGGQIPNMEKILTVDGFKQDDAIWYAALVGPSVIVGRIAGGWLIDRFWAPAVACIMLCLPALSCYFFAQGGLTPEIAMFSIFLLGLAAGVEYDLMAFLVARYFGMKHYGAIYGFLYACFAIGAGTGPAIFGRVFDRTGSYDSVLYISMILLVVGALSLLFLGPYKTFEPSNESHPKPQV